ncbi:MAG TPA: patatin-like phospholipase family protein [Frankiaceae bacterium]|nr:patatin-like phospholipase family protein [Frankiaceae bacterium]
MTVIEAGRRLGRRPRQAAPAPGPFLTCAFGGGGPFGIAYAFGIVDTLAAAGVPVRTSSVLGTSAGSWVGACLAGGVPFSTLRDLPPLRLPDLRVGALQGLTSEVLGDARSAQVRAVAFRLSTGKRLALSGAEHRLSDIVAASSAVPWMFAPVRVGGHRYVDGGVRSLVSADLAPAAEHLLAIAPIAGPMFGPAGQLMEVVLRRELRGWQKATGGKSHLVRPNRAIADLARRPQDLFDSELVRAVYPLARSQAEHLLETRPGIAALVPGRTDRATSSGTAANRPSTSDVA